MAEVTALPTDATFRSLGAARYYNNGDIEIGISPTGLPQFTSVYPAPGKTEEERENAHQNNLRCIAIEGYLLLESTRKKNKMFDKPGECTTWQYIYRTCKNEDEAKGVMSKIKEIIKNMPKKEGSDVEMH